MNDHLNEARRLLEAGWKLVKLEQHTKRPLGTSWNKNFVNQIDEDATGYGFHLAANGACSIDPDNFEYAVRGMARLGFDLVEIMSCGVRTVSTRPGSGGRATFATQDGLRWIKFAAKDPNVGTMLELRAESDNLQDCVPGVTYLDKNGEMCSQSYANGLRLDALPQLPQDFADWWRRCSEDVVFLREQQALFGQASGTQVNQSVSGGKHLAFPASCRSDFNENNKVEDILARHGYTYDERVRRWACPSASGMAGIRPIPHHPGLWRSDHASDPLSGTFDAWSAHVVLDFNSDVDAAVDDWSGNPFAQFVEEETTGFELTPLTLDEVSDAALTPREIVRGYLYADVRLLLAAGGTGKTTLALYEAMMLALGRPVWGFEPASPVRTLFVTKEDSRQILVARLWRIMCAANLSADEERAVLDNIVVRDFTGNPVRVSKVHNDVVEPNFEAISQMIKVWGPWHPDRIVFDPLVSFGVGESRVNDAEQGLIEAFRILVRRLDCCVEAVHHVGKNNARDNAKDQYAGRGGSALADGARMVAVLTVPSAEQWHKDTGEPLFEGETAMELSLAKLSYAPQQPSVMIRRKGWGYQHVERAVSEEASAAETAKSIDDEVFAYLYGEYIKGTSFGKTQFEALCADKNTSTLKVTRPALRAAMVRLETAGKIWYESVQAGRSVTKLIRLNVAISDDDV